MGWNWERPDWPEFSWDPEELRPYEERFLLEAGKFAATVIHLGSEGRDQVMIEVLSREALTTSKIEGEILDRMSVQSSVRRQLGLATDRRQPKPAEQGVAEMMVDLYRTSYRPLTKETLFGWHAMLMMGRDDLHSIGAYRTTTEAMQVVSGSFHRPKIHFEAPPSSRVPAEMTRFVKWFNDAAPGGRKRLPALTRSGLAHLYFESIHPFEDGNGRLGRALSEKALSQAAVDPLLTALATTILIRRKDYYAGLAQATRTNQVTPWLCWFASIVLEAQQRARADVEFVIDKTKLLERLRGRLNSRQEKALHRMLREGTEGFEGGLSAGNYAKITGASPATATRDLADLVEQGALRRQGELRHARYFLAIAPRPVAAVRLEARGRIQA